MPKHADTLIIITTYIPSEDEWIEFRKRRRK
jgi:hypothetical protein